MNKNDYFLSETWNNALTRIKESGQVQEEVFFYFNDSRLYSVNDKDAIVVVPGFINFSVLSQFKTLIETVLNEITGNYYEIKILQESEIEENNKSQILDDYFNKFFSREVDSSFTFDNFVTGRCNLQAQVAADTCAQRPGSMYNPLFIYGGSGVGKTHLLNAIGNKFKSLYPNKIVGFITATEFVDDVFKAKKENVYDELKDTFRKVDLLLVDDIQFLANKTKSHELFFTIFNDLVNNKKQICVTSDQSPDDIRGLEDRLITRFNQGLTVNMVSPEYDTAYNIVKMKTKSLDSQFDDEVISYIATNFSQDVRSLEGAITRLLFFSINFSNDKDHISLDTALEAFRDQVNIQDKNSLTTEKIMKTVCNYYGLNKAQITSNIRTKNIATARHIAIYLSRKLLDEPYDKIGEKFGGRDHSTIISSCRKVEDLIKRDQIYLKVINDIETKLK